MGSRWKKTSHFMASDPAGRKHIVYVFTQFVDTTNSEDGAGETPNLVSLKLANGTHLNKIGSGKYQTIGATPDFEVASTDPQAA